MDYERQERPTFEQKVNSGLGVLRAMAFPAECFCRRNVGRHWIGFRWAYAGMLMLLWCMIWAGHYDRSRDAWADPTWVYAFFAVMCLRAAWLQAETRRAAIAGRHIHRHYLGDCVYADWSPHLAPAQVMLKREFGINLMFSIGLAVLNGPVGTMLIASSIACRMSLDWTRRQEGERISRIRDQQLEAEWMSRELDE